MRFIKTGGLIVLIGFILFGLSGCSLFNRGPKIQNWQPTTSPDGKKIIFADKHEKDFELYRMDLPQGNQSQLTSNDSDDWAPSWSPNGDYVAFVSNRDDNADIYVMTVQGKNERRLTSDSGQDVNPEWLTSERIIFNSDRSGKWHIYTINLDGSGLTQVTSAPPESESSS